MMEKAEKKVKEAIQAGYRYALALTHHHFEAEDLVQEAWMRVFSRYGRLPARTVLYTTIRHIFVDRCRRSNIATFESLEGHAEPGGGGEGVPGGSLDLDVILASLRSNEREVLYLNAVEGFSAAEIAGLTGQPRNTVLSLLHRGKQRIQECSKLRREVHESDPMEKKERIVMSEVEQRIRDYYAQQELDGAALDRICQAGRLTRRRWWAPAGWAVAAVLAVVFSLSAIFLSSPDDRLTESVALEVLKNHEKQLEPETTATTFQDIQVALPRLSFTLAPENPALLGDWQPTGGRYCSLSGELAAQISLQNSRGEGATLYIAPLTPTLARVDSCVRHYDGAEVHFWRDAHRLFAMAASH